MIEYAAIGETRLGPVYPDWYVDPRLALLRAIVAAELPEDAIVGVWYDETSPRGLPAGWVWFGYRAGEDVLASSRPRWTAYETPSLMGPRPGQRRLFVPRRGAVAWHDAELMERVRFVRYDVLPELRAFFA